MPLFLFGSVGVKRRKEEIIMLYSEEKVKELFDAEKFLIRGQDVIPLHQVMKHFGKLVTPDAINKCVEDGMTGVANIGKENEITYLSYNGLKTIVSSCNVNEYCRLLREEEEEENEERKKKEKKRKGYVVVKEEKKKNG